MRPMNKTTILIYKIFYIEIVEAKVLFGQVL